MFESIESRKLFSALTFNAAQTNAFLQTTSGADSFVITQSGSTLSVTSGGTTRTYNGFDSIFADLGGGNDSFQVASSVTVPCTITAGSGNDSITGGNGNDSITGGDGADGVSGRAGNDTIQGGTGNDSLYGNNGNDQIDGDDGLDLIAGGTGADRLGGTDYYGTLPVDSYRDDIWEGDYQATQTDGAADSISVSNITSPEDNIHYGVGEDTITNQWYLI